VKYDTATPYTASFIIIRKDAKMAFLLRTGTGWMNGHYGLPSGKVEVGESMVNAALREAEEEIGIKIKKDDLRAVIVVDRAAAKTDEVGANAWVDAYFEAVVWEGEPYNAEPDKHGELVWLDPNNLPENVVPHISAAIKDIMADKTYSDYGY
jgi:8-oxo-dGTP diphosphatase